MRTTELVSSSTFRLALVYTVLFAGSVLLLLGFIYWSTVAFMTSQVDTTIETEIVGLAEQYRERGLNGLIRTINDRLERNPDSASIYLFASPSLRPLAGNLSRWPGQAATEDGWLDFNLEDPEDELAALSARARIFSLRGNFHLLVGRDVRELQVTRQLIERALLWGLVITIGLGLLGGFTMSRSMLGRLEEINATSREIMAGDLSRRVPTRGRHDDFDQLADNLNAMLDEIGRLMDGIRHVSDNIAHDLRTPLTRLRQRLETLAASPQPSDQQRDQIDAAIADADQLLQTFSALLRIARIEAGGYQPKQDPIDLAALVMDAHELYDAVAEQRGLSITTEILAHPTIRGDRDLIFQALTNLVDNALKYSPAGGAIHLTAGTADTGAWLRVTDSGPGIPAEERDKVIRRFHRLEQSRSTAGSGLGLSLVAAIASMHKAELELASNEPGLRATLRFPIEAVADSGEANSAHAAD
jgi:signal transduction histidine kinase